MERVHTHRSLLALVLLTALGVTLQTPCSGVDGATLERVVKKDGTSITGEVVGFANGHYSVRVGDSVIEIPALDVRTIIEVNSGAGQVPEQSQPRADAVTVEDVLQALTLRGERNVSAELLALYREAVAAVVRGEWDISLQSLETLQKRSAQWADPQILRGILLSEQGNEDSALTVALWLERRFADDVVALQVAGEIYRRGGFAIQYGKTMERVLAAGNSGERLQYELAHLWWEIDVERARDHWRRYRDADPRLQKPWCSEGKLLKRAQLSLNVRDWHSAQKAARQLLRDYPWMADQVAPLRTEILEARLRSAIDAGRLEEALVSCDTLQELQGSRRQEWQELFDELQSVLLRGALRLQDVAALREWCHTRTHLFADDSADATWRVALSIRYQELALAALAEGDLATARSGFDESQQWEQRARPQDLAGLFEGFYTRAFEELRLGRRSKVLQMVALVRSAYPERIPALQDGLTPVFREALSTRLSGQDISLAVGQLHGVLKSAPGTAVTEVPRATGVAIAGSSEPGTVPVDTASTAVARESLARYFPHQVGTRWVYRRGDGSREVREVVSLTPLEGDGWKIGFEIRDPSGGSSYPFQAFLVGTDLLFHSQLVPPGEVALRFPFAPGVHWSWKKEIFHYARSIERPEEPLHLPTGTFEDYVVVLGENRIELGASAAEKEYKSWSRVTFVAGLGLVRIESDNPSRDRVLIEYLPPRD